MEFQEKCEKKKEDVHAINRTSTKLRDFMPTIDSEFINKKNRPRRFLDFLKAHPSKEWFLKFGYVGRLSPFAFLRRNATRRQGSLSEQPPTSDIDGVTTIRRNRFRVPFVRKINWPYLIHYGKNWIKHPMNMAFLLWLVFVAAGLILLGLLMLGALDDVLKSDVKTRWEEITNQIVNALFTIMCLYQHPQLFHHLVILCRWKPSDEVEIRSTYCKGSTPKPYDRAHFVFLLVLLHITCFSQYVLCGLYWGYTSKTRPDIILYSFVGIGIIAPVTALLYTVYGPLGKKRKVNSQSQVEPAATDEESQRSQSADACSTNVYSGSRRVVVTEPEWIGGLFDCRDDLTVASLSFFCTFCVFGWNVERLGFGNMYVHIATFVLLCIAPISVFYVASTNISDSTLKYIVEITGIVLCFFGLLYGGYWRIQMRKKFKLPKNPFCCGYAFMTDCMQWLFCWPCALAQEVRTGNFYEIEEDSFYNKDDEEERPVVLLPLPREGEMGPVTRTNPDSSFKTTKESSVEHLSISIEGDVNKGEKEKMMSPPIPPLINMEVSKS